MLQQAYLARKASEDSFDSLDQEFLQFQKDHPRATSYIVRLPDEPNAEEVKGIAFHFSDAGYDVFSTVFNKLEIDWAFAEEGRTGVINIRNDCLRLNRNAVHKNEE